MYVVGATTKRQHMTAWVAVMCPYAFRTDTVTLTGQYQYPDNKPGDVDAFSREPFVVRFKASKAGRSSATH